MFALLVGSLLLAAEPELNGETLESLRDYIRPKQQELAFLKIEWRASLAAAANEARVANRPVLLWAMNGHPLGCT